MKLLKELINEGKKDKDKIVVDALKPRNKQLNDVLVSRKGGRMKDKRKDYNRQDEKQKARNNDE